MEVMMTQTSVIEAETGKFTLLELVMQAAAHKELEIDKAAPIVTSKSIITCTLDGKRFAILRKTG